MRTLVVGLLVIAAVSACRSDSGSDAWADRFGGAAVLVVDNHDAIWREDDVWSVASEPNISIGLLHGPPQYQLFDVAAAARKSDGAIVVVDGGTREVRLFDRTGSFVKTMGSSGSGPGEFQDPSQVLVTATDEMLVWDNANYRITRFDSAGEFMGVQSVERNGLIKEIDPPLYPWTAGLLLDGQVVVRLIEKTGKTMAPGISRPLSGALRVSADLSQIDTLMFFGGTEQVNVRAPWGLTPIVPPLAKTTLIAIQPTLPRTCMGDQEGPEVVCFGPGGSATAIRWISEAGSATDWEVAAWRDTTIEMYALKMTDADARRVLQDVTAAPVRPYYSRLVLDRVGNLWVERAPVNWMDPGPVDYIVFDPEGVLLGAVTLPPIDAIEIGDDYVLGIYRDEMEVEYLQVHAIIKPLLTDADS